MTMEPVLLLAPAKLTLSLQITGVLGNGMHTIDAEMVTLDLFDELRVSLGGSGVRLAAQGLPVELDSHDNLITRAADLAGVQIGVDLTKRIPAGAGLGGGSADAAAVLRWAGFDDYERASTIGADVSFCLVGGRARVRGIGEQIEPLPFVQRSITLMTPAVHCSTPAVYAMWDKLGGPVGENGNDLEPAALVVAPELAVIRDQFGDATGETPRLAGSGSSWFVFGSFPDAGIVLQTLPAESSTEVLS